MPNKLELILEVTDKGTIKVRQFAGETKQAMRELAESTKKAAGATGQLRAPRATDGRHSAPQAGFIGYRRGQRRCLGGGAGGAAIGATGILPVSSAAASFSWPIAALAGGIVGLPILLGLLQARRNRPPQDIFEEMMGIVRAGLRPFDTSPMDFFRAGAGCELKP